MPSIKKNFAFNLILTVSTYLFSLVVFPYVSRVLGVELIGRVSFADQVQRYFQLFAMMGVTTVGIREISACGNDRARRSEVFSSLLIIILVLTAISVVGLIAVTFTVQKLSNIKDLLVIGSFGLFFNSLLVEWFYQGLENFRYVTVRTVIVKCFYVVAIFLLVRKQDDYLWYYGINVVCISVNALINIVHSRKFVDFSLRSVHIKSYAKPVFSLGIYMLALSFFTTFNVVYLGVVQTEYQTGLYAASIKIYQILLAVISAFTAVMMPRMSALISENKVEELNRKIECSWNLVFAFSLPIAIGCIILSPQIVSILAGDAFIEAALPMSIVMLNLFIVSAAQIWVMQVLLPMKKDRIVLISSIFSAVTGVILNVVLVGRAGALGSAVAIVAAELVGDSISFVYALKNGYVKFPLSQFIKFLVCSLPYVVICVLCKSMPLSSMALLVVAFFLCLGYFVVLNKWIMKGTFLCSIFNKVLWSSSR